METPTTPSVHHVPAERSETRRAIVHELKLTLVASLLVNVVWWTLVNLIGINFPLIHLALIVGALFLLPILDHKEYPSDPSTQIFAIRAGTNFFLFLFGLIVTSPSGGILVIGSGLSGGPFFFLMSYFAIVAMLGFLRAAIHFAWVLIKHFK